MIDFGMGFLSSGMVGVFIMALCVTSLHNGLNIKDNMEESDE